MAETVNLKIGMFGGGGVGKTCLTLRYLKGEFSDGYIPTIEDEFTKVVNISDKTVSLAVIDTAGQDDFAEMRYSYFSQVQGFVYVFDISNPSSIDDLRRIYNDAKESVDDGIKCVIAANKADYRSENKSDLVPTTEYKKLEDEFKCKVIETSAKTGSGVEDLFHNIITKLIAPERKQTQVKSSENKSSSTKKSESGGEGGCCNIA